MAGGLIVGGLGGGGDIGLALVVVEGFKAWSRVEAIASFGKCRAGGRRGVGTRVRGALVRLDGEDLDRRVFEDKLARAGVWSGDVYLLCTREEWRGIVEGLEWLVERYSPSCILSADIGGDGILLGYEDSLGSYVTDTVAKAALAWASREHGVRGIIAAGGIGAEGGGSELDLPSIYTTLTYLDHAGAILGAWAPEPVHAGVAWRLLEYAESGMLPLYLAAVEGRSRAEVRQAYLSGVYEVKPWYRYVVFLDPVALCEASPLCKSAWGRGESGVAKWRRPKPPREYASIFKEASRLAASGRLDAALASLLDRLASRMRFSPRRC